LWAARFGRGPRTSWACGVRPQVRQLPQTSRVCRHEAQGASTRSWEPRVSSPSRSTVGGRLLLTVVRPVCAPAARRGPVVPGCRHRLGESGGGSPRVSVSPGAWHAGQEQAGPEHGHGGIRPLPFTRRADPEPRPDSQPSGLDSQRIPRRWPGRGDGPNYGLSSRSSLNNDVGLLSAVPQATARSPGDSPRTLWHQVREPVPP